MNLSKAWNTILGWVFFWLSKNLYKQCAKYLTSRLFLFKGKCNGINFVSCICATSVSTCLSKCIKCYEVLEGAIKEL